MWGRKKYKPQLNKITVWKTTIKERENSAVTFPHLKNCKTVITPNRQPCFWHVQITCPNNTGWPVTSPVLFNQAKNSRDKALMAKSGQKHGHYLALRRFCGVGNCLKILFGTLMSCSNWAEKSSNVVPQGRGSNRRTGSSGIGGILIFQQGWRAKRSGRGDGSKLENWRANAPLRQQQTSGSSPLRFVKLTEDMVQRVPFIDPFWVFDLNFL